MPRRGHSADRVCSAECTSPPWMGRPSGSTPSRSASPGFAARRAREPPDVDVHQLAPACARRSRSAVVAVGLRPRAHVRLLAQFSFEHDIDGARRATRERAIDYPIVVDNDYAVWSAFATKFWPALYFVDADGSIRHPNTSAKGASEPNTLARTSGSRGRSSATCRTSRAMVRDRSSHGATARCGWRWRPASRRPSRGSVRHARVQEIPGPGACHSSFGDISWLAFRAWPGIPRDGQGGTS